MKSYRTLAGPSEGLYRERGSKFLATATPIQQVEEVSMLLAASRKLHPKARHHCFAYRLGYDGESIRMSDDGEPSGTAGKPILNQLIARNLTSVVVIVVRYFGGKLLGAAGLLRAYRMAAELALDNAQVETRYVMTSYAISCPFEHVGRLEEQLGKLNVLIYSRDFNAVPRFLVGLPMGEESTCIARILSGTLNLPLEQIGDAPKYGGIEFTPSDEKESHLS
ncbi:MAG: YigZ family protein [Saprospiraceae bacterium]|nr:YigZ family protein [Saprospiraceae bacterium]